MKALWFVFLGAVIGATHAAHAGTIKGSVHAEGKAGVDDPNCSPANYESRALKFAQRIDYSAIHDFVVSIEGPVNATNAAAPKTMQVVTRKIAQHKAKFEPHVLAVMKGTTVEWPNNDEIFHNVFSYSEAQPFDLGLYKDPPKSVTFTTPGRVDVFCSIHSSMSCVVLVLENPYFAVTNEKGEYVIPNVPPGTYKLKAWHERLPTQRREIVVPETGDIKVDFTLGITGLPKL